MATASTIRDNIEAAFRKDTRKAYLNIKPHFLPASEKILQITLKHVFNTLKDIEEQGFGEVPNFSNISSKIINKIKDISTHTVIDTTKLPPNFLETLDTGFPYIVNTAGKFQGILFKSYDRVYDNIFRDFIGKELNPYFKESRYESFKYKKGVDIGHTIDISEYGLASTPLYEKLILLKDAINEGLGIANASLTNLGKVVDSSIAKLEAKSSYGRRIVATFDKDFKQFLLSVSANIVIIQDRLENQYFYGNQIEGVIEREITSQLKKANFSNNIIQEIHSAVVSPLTKTARHLVKKTVKTSPIEIKSRVKVNTTTTTSKTITKTKRKVVEPVKPLFDLEALLRARINEQVRKNMGSGNESRILNYRTGRFSESVSIERLSESRQGMITVFYNYMKNPYATFSEGGRQQYPKTRDPKLLISKSIREIAAPYVSNRLRSVVV